MSKLGVLARAQELTGDTGAARLLEQIHFRYKGALANGKTSTPQSYRNLMDDTKFTFKMVKRGLRVLRERSFIVAEQHLFYGKNVCHYVIPGQVMLALEGQVVLAPEGQLGMALEGQHLTTTSVTKSITTSICDQSQATVAMAGENSPKAFAGEIGGMKIHEMFEKKVHAEKANKLLHKPDATLSLAHLWQTEVNAATGAYVPTLTRRALRDLKNFREKCPPGKAGLVLTWAIKNWAFFAKRVQVMHNEKFVPSQPTLGFLLRWAGSAVTMFEPPKAPEKHEAPKVIFDPQTVQLPANPAEAADPLKQTLAEIYADPDED